MEILTRAFIIVSAAAFLTGFSITALTGSARAVKYCLGILTAIFILAAVAGFIFSRGLLIFLLFQIIIMVLILFFMIITGAVCGGGMYMLIHKKPAGKKITEAEIEEYLPLPEFCKIEAVTEERALSRIKNGFYRGGVYDGRWYVHNSELS